MKTFLLIGAFTLLTLPAFAEDKNEVNLDPSSVGAASATMGVFDWVRGMRDSDEAIKMNDLHRASVEKEFRRVADKLNTLAINTAPAESADIAHLDQLYKQMRLEDNLALREGMSLQDIRNKLEKLRGSRVELMAQSPAFQKLLDRLNEATGTKIYTKAYFKEAALESSHSLSSRMLPDHPQYLKRMNRAGRAMMRGAGLALVGAGLVAADQLGSAKALNVPAKSPERPEAAPAAIEALDANAASEAPESATAELH